VADRIQLPEVLPDREHSFMMYPLVVRHEPKEELVAHLEVRGIETRDMMPLTNQPALRDHVSRDAGAYPVAEWINRCGIYVGCHQDLSLDDMDWMADRILDYFYGA